MAENTEPRPGDRVDEGEDQLIAHLRDLAEAADPVPEDVTLAARSAIAWRNLDAELAELTIDSDTEAKELSGVRSVGTLASRQVTWESGEYVIDIEVSREGGIIKLIGQCSPAQELPLTIHTLEASQEMTTDELGRFRAELPGSRLRIEVRWPDAERPIVTEWLTV